ncbi:MAG TPA: sulfatase-like hydrolase/transferase [Parafilimonas sp.]|nr:sulfatase-like hydrolase/transferase [Parafilimonas sp.]
MSTLSIRTIIFFLFILFITSCRKADFTEAITADSNVAAINAAVKPNIILILADDVGYETPNYTGGQSYSTPGLNYMAANGTRFTNCYTAPLCSPSRFMLMTAKYNFRNYTTWGKMDTTEHTIANLLKKAGYATCVTGKWQFDGGDASIRALGFNKYLVSNPFNPDEDDAAISMYKNPQVYEKGKYWPASKVEGKYGEDLFRDYMFDFIDDNKNKKPFFIYWSLNLVHKPFSPTPDDPEFASWNPLKKQQPGDSIYYPSMVKYMDKLVGQLLTKLQADSLQSKTLVLFVGDNGSAAGIHSLWNGQVVEGGKSSPTAAGTHVPMVAYMRGHVIPNVDDTSLISLVDFMPTLAKVGGTNIPKSYGTTDGISFYKQLLGNYTGARPWVFCHFPGAGKNETDPLFLKRWMNDHNYKQYDSLPNAKFSKRFFNIKLDPAEQHPIPFANMTPKEKTISKEFLANMKQLH